MSPRPARVVAEFAVPLGRPRFCDGAPAEAHALERDILAHMDFRPVMRTPPVPMDARIFAHGKMGLAHPK